MPDSETDFRDNPAQQRFELLVAGQAVAVAEYRLQGGTITFTHTEVQPGHAGQGLGSRLAARALDDVRQRQLAVVAACSFIADWIDKHPEYRSLLER